MISAGGLRLRLSVRAMMVPPADHGQVVGVQERDLLQEITEQERVRGDHPGQGRSQGDPLGVEGAIEEELFDLFLTHTFNSLKSRMIIPAFSPQPSVFSFSSSLVTRYPSLLLTP